MAVVFFLAQLISRGHVYMRATLKPPNIIAYEAQSTLIITSVTPFLPLRAILQEYKASVNLILFVGAIYCPRAASKII